MPDTQGFVQFFFEKLQEWAFKYGIDGKKVSYSPREYFASYEVENHRSFQRAAGATAGLLFGKSPQDAKGLTECLMGLTKRLDNKTDLYFHLDKSGITEQTLVKDIRSIWRQLTQLTSTQISQGYRSIGDFLTDDELDELSQNFVALAFPLLCFAGEDYDAYGQDIVGTAAYNIPRIIANHYPEVTHAWLRSFDSFYLNDKTPVTMAPSAKAAPSPPAAAVLGQFSEQFFSGGALAQPLTVRFGDRLRLLPEAEASRDAGEALYYRFLSGKTDGVWHAAADPIPMTAELFARYGEDSDVITLEVVAAHHGVKLAPVTLRLEARDFAVVSVPAGYENGELQYEDYRLIQGERLELRAPRPDGGSFDFLGWSVRTYDAASGRVGEALDQRLVDRYFSASFYRQFEDTVVVNNVPLPVQTGFRFIPLWGEHIDDVTLTLHGRSESGLPSLLQWSETEGGVPQEDLPVSWEAYTDSAGEPQSYHAQFVLEAPAGKVFDVDMLLAREPRWILQEDYPLLAGMEPTVLDILGSGEKIQIEARFARLGEPAPPLVPVGLSGSGAVVRTVNLATGQAVGEERYHFYSHGSTVQVCAPVVENMEFVGWQDDPTADTIRWVAAGAQLVARYLPLVRSVEAVLSGPVVPGQALPRLERVSLDGVSWTAAASTEWVDPAETADYGTLYCLRISLPRETVGRYGFHENALTAVRTTGGSVLDPTGVYLYDGASTLEVYLYWMTPPLPTEKPVIESFEEVDVTVAPGSTVPAILEALPDTVGAFLQDGRLVPVRVEWTDADAPDPQRPEGQSVRARGRLGGEAKEAYDLANGVSLTANVTVRGAPQTQPPMATPSGGVLVGEQTVALTAQPGATIRVAVVPVENGAAAPEEEGLVYQEVTGLIPLTQLGKTVYLFASAQMPGLRDSDVVRYTYRLETSCARNEDCPLSAFSDLDSMKWYHEGIHGCVEKGLMVGVGEGRFAPTVPPAGP